MRQMTFGATKRTWFRKKDRKMLWSEINGYTRTMWRIRESKHKAKRCLQNSNNESWKKWQMILYRLCRSIIRSHRHKQVFIWCCGWEKQVWLVKAGSKEERNDLICGMDHQNVANLWHTTEVYLMQQRWRKCCAMAYTMLAAWSYPQTHHTIHHSRIVSWKDNLHFLWSTEQMLWW